ncbi:MAG: protein kinase domain-containing protein [Burkholderiales bacterium]|nr:bifunctional protein-serine/threonine kinase/phosphatase [Ferrovum sp.]
MSSAFVLGFSSLTGPRARNEDFCGAVTPNDIELENKGLLAAVADGVGGHSNANEASEYVVRGLLADYYATPDTWGVFHALDTVIQSLNRWLFAQNQSLRHNAGMATTLSALLLRGGRYYFAHVGDSRIYRFHEGTFQRLTNDHVWDHPELNTVLSRAVGLDAQLVVDYGDGELATGDRFLICSDGVWNRLGEQRMSESLVAHPDAQDAASHLTLSAVSAGSQDNCTALVVCIQAIPAARLRDALIRTSRLPIPDRLKAGDALDGVVIVRVLHASRVTVLYEARIGTTGQSCVLKTLRQDCDGADASALAHEEWLARRVVDAAFPQVIPSPGRSYLYYLMTWHEGATLGQWLRQGRHFSPAETVDVGIRLLKGLGALHRLSIVHRDIKPENVHLGADGRLRILDLGVAASDGQEFGEINNPGTPSYMAPELHAGKPASETSDLYACGVTMYELLTRKFPYGEIEPFQHPRFGDPVSPTRYRPDIPEWLETILLKAVAREPEDRFETIEEFLLALEKGVHGRLRVPRKMPLLKRDPALVLKVSVVLSLVVNVLLLYLLLIR